MNTTRYASLLATGLLLVATVGAWGAPGLINYQGRLTDGAGQPIATAVDVTFSFYDAEVGGNQLAAFSDTDTVTPNADGLYATLIGDEPDNLVPDAIFSADNVWINVNYNGEDLLPRKRVTSVAYSFRSTSTVKNMLYDFVVASGQSVSAGDVVAMLNDGTVKPGSGAAFGAGITFNTGYTGNISAAPLSSDSFVVVYKDTDNSGYDTAVVGQVGGYGIAFGPEVILANNSASDYPVVTALSPTDFVVTYTNSGNRGEACVGHVAGNVITLGPTTLSGSWGLQYAAISALSSTKFVVAWKDSYWGNAAVVADIADGENITFGDPHMFGNWMSSHSYLATAALSDSRCVIAYGTPYGAAIIADVSGTTTTFSPEGSFTGGLAYYLSIVALSPTQLALTYMDTSNSNRATAMLGGISGTDFAWGTPTALGTDEADFTSVAAFSSSTCLFTFNEGRSMNPHAGKAVIAEVSGDVFVPGSVVTFSAPQLAWNQAIALSDTKYALAYQFTSGGTTTGRAFVGQSADLGSTSATPLGIADAAAAEGQSVPVILEGISDHHSGLLLGTAYFANPDGSLATSDTGAPVGRAIAADKLLLGFGR